MAPQTHKGTLWKVLGIYVGASWMVLQVVDVLTQNMGLPPWVFSFAVILLVIGLPIVGATAYLQGLGTPEVSEPSGRAAARVTPHGLFTWRNAIAGGVGGLALWGAVAAGWMLLGSSAPASNAEAGAASASDLRSVAVLPFATRSSSDDDRYFSEGMHDDLLTQLSKIDSLKVISRTSVMQYAGSGKSIPEIARELGVATVLEGGVDRSGDRVRVNVQLIEAATDEHLWAETYDQELTAANVFAIRSDLAKKIAGALRTKLTAEAEARIAVRPTQSLEAFDLYTRARYLFENRASLGEMIPETRELFDKAIEADSTFALAWVGRANTFLSAWNWQRLSPEEARRGTEESLRRALELDPDLAEAHVAASRLAQWDGRVDDAIAAIERALELNPGLVEAHARFGQLLEQQGRHEEALREATKAVDLDPLSIPARNLLADRLWFAERYEGSITESRKILDMDPGSWYAWYNIGWSEAMLRRTDDALAAFRTALDLSPEQSGTITLGMAYAFARGGQPDSALAIVSRVPPEAYDVSIVYFEAGDAERAFESLERTLRADPSQLIRLEGDPSGAPLRADPRYGTLIDRLGLR
jgi:TolB-like protein/cytochrome c-type biogenesis protein CcmH/NrfG